MLFTLLMIMPLTAMAAEHGGKAMQEKGPGQQSSEHAGKAAERGEAMPNKGKEHAGQAAEHGGKPAKKETREHAGFPVN